MKPNTAVMRDELSDLEAHALPENAPGAWVRRAIERERRRERELERRAESDAETRSQASEGQNKGE